MRRALSSLLPVLALVAAVLVPGAAVFAQAEGDPCAIDRSTRESVVDAVDLVAVAAVEVMGESVTLRPEAYLKGAATGHQVRLARPESATCPLAGFVDGSRVLVLAKAGDSGYEWPAAAEVYVLAGGQAANGASPPERSTEEAIVGALRAITGQYAVPADNPDDGASIEWTGTVLPVGLGLLVVLGIALVMMREWHRIDPS